TRDLHSFPTRRSSDLVERNQLVAQSTEKAPRACRYAGPSPGPISRCADAPWSPCRALGSGRRRCRVGEEGRTSPPPSRARSGPRSEEHTSELQSRENL